MTESKYQGELEDLEQRFRTLRQFSREDPRRLKELLPRVVAGLHRSLDEFQTSVAGAARSERARARNGRKPGTPGERNEHEQAETRLALQYTIARIVSEARTLEEAAAPILDVLCASLDWEVGELWAVRANEPAPRCVERRAAPSLDGPELEERTRSGTFALGRGAPQQSAAPLWIADLSCDEGLASEPEVQRAGLHTMFRLPVAVHGDVCAVLRLFCRRIRQEDGAAVEFLMSVGAQIGQLLERLHSEALTRESDLRKGAILEASLDAVITVDGAGDVIEFNSAAERLFGYRRQEALGRGILELIVPPRLRAEVLDGVARYHASGETGLLGRHFDTFATRADGAEFPVEVAMAPIAIGDAPLLTVFVRDATARKATEREVKGYQERLRSLMADLLLAEEHERRRLAFDLHDGLSQTIALAQMKLSVLRLSLDERLAPRLVEIEELIEQANRSARTIGFELSPPVLHDLGLLPALQWLVENLQARYGIQISLQADGRAEPAHERTRVILFRSIRELLINAAKHAGACRVQVRLRREGNDLAAAVEDDGVGMPADLATTRGSGLFSIQERLNHVGGSMRIESTPGRGTRIFLSAPLTNRNGKTEELVT